MGWPLILAGPILRRVEPNQVSVWVALKEKRTVKLSVWQGGLTTGPGTGVFTPTDQALFSGEAETLQIGEKLHIVVVTAKAVSTTNPLPLLPNNIYSYNLSFSDTEDLKSLKLLQDGLIEEKPHLALGYDSNRLPSFATCPIEITDLQILHGSCRKTTLNIEDGLSWVDDLVKPPNLNAPLSRPHQLMLSGDQIYADEISLPLLPHLIAVGNRLLGNSEFLPLVSVGDEDVTFHLADKIHFPPGLRDRFVDSDARFTTSDKHSHLLSFGEFSAMYLLSWSNVLWDVPSLQDFDVTMAEISASPQLPPLWKNIFRKRKKSGSLGEENIATSNSLSALFTDENELLSALKSEEDEDKPLNLDNLKSGDVLNKLSTVERARFPNIYNFALSLNPKDLFDFKNLIEEMQSLFGERYRKNNEDERKQSVTRFYNSLPKVRRALANVPTYMMFDDHDVTDDWYLNPMWRDRVLTAPLGKTIIRNGLLSYALFQGWGNDPEQFRSGDYAVLLQKSTELFPLVNPPFTPDEENEAASEIDILLGLDGNDPPIKWHYSVQGSRHKLLALDNRTRRSFVSRIGPPGNVSILAMEDQIPVAAAGDDVLVVMAPLPVLGVPVIDELIGPLSYKGFDITGHTKVDQMPGSNPDAIEGWAYDAVTFEALLKRLEPYRRVVLLSGDVHFGACHEMSYWKKGDLIPARFAQFISSGLRNVMPSYVRFVSQSLAFAQKILQLEIGTERLGWDLNEPEPLVFPANVLAAPILRSKLRTFPVLVPTHGWPEETIVNIPPDWAWRLNFVRDERPDVDRPIAARPESLGGELEEPEYIQGYRRTAVRHAKQLNKMNHSRQIVFAHNLGLVTFLESTEGHLTAKQELYSVPNGAEEGEHAEVYSTYLVKLDRVEDEEIHPAIGVENE